MPPKSRKTTRSTHHPIRHGPAVKKRKPGPAPAVSKPSLPPVLPPGPADVWRWARIGLLDGLIFLAASLAGSIVTARTQNPWIFMLGLVVAIILTNVRRLPARPKAIKSGYFSGMAGLFCAGMLAMLFVFPREAWAGIGAFAAAMAAISLVALRIGLKAAVPPDEPGDHPAA